MSYREVDLPCPECGVSLEQVGDRDKWRCPSCKGALVGVTELELVETLVESTTTRPRQCPHCRVDMFTFDLVGLTLDRCITDNVLWFDPGELGKLCTAAASPIEGWATQWADKVRFAF